MDVIGRSLGSFWSRLDYLLSGTYTEKVLVTFGDLFSTLWYYLLAGIMITAIISTFWNPEKIPGSVFKPLKVSWISLLVVSVLGVISPMPIYVVIPFVAALFSLGIPAPILMAFLVSSPLMNPALFLLTAGALGYEMAIARTLCALILGVSAGYATRFFFTPTNMEAFFGPRSSPRGLPHAHDAAPARTILQTMADFRNELYRFSKFITKFFMAGILIAAVVQSLIPADWIINTLGKNRSASILIATAAGIPLYACGGGTIPVMQVLLNAGMDKGAILAFLLSGPATKFSTLMILKAALAKEIFFVYLGITIAGAMLFGYIYSFLG